MSALEYKLGNIIIYSMQQNALFMQVVVVSTMISEYRPIQTSQNSAGFRPYRVGPKVPGPQASHRIALILMVTDCSAKRSFSKLKLTENRLRIITQGRLVNLVIMSTESDILHDINYCHDDSINARKVSVL